MAVSSQRQVSIFVEKSAESETEENGSEKEIAEEGDSELSSFGKSKKVKKSPPKFSANSTPLAFTAYCDVPSWALQVAQKPVQHLRPLALSCPRYIAYHQLIFYEI